MTAAIVGILFLTATGSYLLGDSLINAVLDAPDYLADVYPNRSWLTIGVLLEFVNSAAVIGIGVLLFPVLRQQSEAIALGYTATRIVESVTLVIGGIGTLALIAVSRETIQVGTSDDAWALTMGELLMELSHAAFLSSMVALGLGSLPFCYLLYRSRLVPRSMAILGLIGYAALLTGAVVALFGDDLQPVFLVPGTLFELIFPIWLIARGFNPAATVPKSARSDVDDGDTRMLAGA